MELDDNQIGIASNARCDLLFDTVQHQSIQVALPPFDVEIKDQTEADHEELKHPKDRGDRITASKDITRLGTVQILVVAGV